MFLGSDRRRLWLALESPRWPRSYRPVAIRFNVSSTSHQFLSTGTDVLDGLDGLVTWKGGVQRKGRHVLSHLGLNNQPG